MTEFVDKEIHNDVVKQNRKLASELAVSQQETKRVKKACRELAVWAYNERERLMRELASVVAKTPAIKKQGRRGIKLHIFYTEIIRL